MNQRRWLVVYWTLFVAFIVTAALNMLHVRVGFLTNHAADLVVPAWLYIVFRGLHSRHGRQTLVQRTLGQTPERAALVLFVASTLTEISQFYWPRGLFPDASMRWMSSRTPSDSSSATSWNKRSSVRRIVWCKTRRGTTRASLGTIDFGRDCIHFTPQIDAAIDS